MLCFLEQKNQTYRLRLWNFSAYLGHHHHHHLFHDEASDDTPQCRPVRKVAYLKAHKCASTTMQNIFLRHALSQDLDVVVPATGVYLAHGDERFR